MKKRFVSLTLAASLAAVSLAGCGSSDADATTAAATTAADTTAAEKTEEAETTAQAAESGENVTLKWSVWDISLTTYYEPLIEAFEASHPGVTVEMVDLGSSDYQTVLATELTGSGSDFDVVCIKDVPGYATLVNKGVLEPLDDLIAKDGIDLSAYG